MFHRFFHRRRCGMIYTTLASGWTAVDFPKCDLWDFSQAFYRHAEVEAACLYLQNHHAANVNLILLACWVGLSGRGVMEVAQFRELSQQVAVWQQQVVQPLRQVRQQLKGMSGYGDETIRQMRKKVLECELEAEHREQLMLERSLEFFHPVRELPQQQRNEDATINLRHYFAFLEISVAESEAQGQRLLRPLLSLQQQGQRVACLNL